MNKSVLEITDLTVSYSKKPVLWNVSLDIPSGSLACIMGPNGAGKSTLIKGVMGLIPLASGVVKIFGEDLQKVRSRIAYVPQKETVDWDFPASAFDVVLMGRYGKLGLFKRPGKADKQIALECLEKVGMQEFASRQISQLSGGQQQRVFLARALAQEAELYFLDEPFAGVDAATEKAIVDLLREMAKSGKTVITVHHDIQSAPSYFDFAVLLNLRLVAAGAMDKVFNNENLQATYGGKLTLLAEVSQLIGKNEFPQREK
jgi:manganese/zinc/iron transport system ATP- binding protein